ncbi:cell wall protein RBR3-like [Haliotis rufescens]|uniref:cell wall protein RBR3-like n=1 Tax=Haliotis rufescens TaxID=6454 RepID=UPI00201ED105|nr:cell wall protein RBR3-like [Haliotis rufescens]
MTWKSTDSVCGYVWLSLLVAGVRGWIADGSNYIIACPKLPSASLVKCTLHVQGSEGTEITLNGSGSGYPRTETITDLLAISIVIQEASSSAFILTVHTTDVVSIFVQNEANGTTSSSYLALALDASLSVPYTGPSFENVFMSFPISPPEHNLYIVASAYAATVVTIGLKSTGPVVFESITYYSGDTITVSVGALLGIEIITEEDLTGSLVTSDKPVGVFSGTIVGETLEQIPTMSKWGTPTPVLNTDLCNSDMFLAVVSEAGTLQINENNSVLEIPLLKGGAHQYSPNNTGMIQGTSALVGLRCLIGENDKPLLLTLNTFASLGTEYKCVTFSGFVNTLYITGFKTVDTPYDINGQAVNFTLVDTYSAATVSTFRERVPDGFFVVKSYDTFPFLPYVIGVTPDGTSAYAHACALGSLGTLLPEPSSSLPSALTSMLDSASESVHVTSSITETSVDVALSSSVDIAPSSTLAESSSLSQNMEYSTSEPTTSVMDVSPWASSDVASSSALAASSSSQNMAASPTTDTSFSSTAQVVDNSIASSSPSATDAATSDTSLATSFYILATSTSNNAVTSSFASSNSNNAVTSSFASSTSNNAVTSSFATSTNNNAVTSSFATSTSNNAVTSSFATSTSNNAVTSSFETSTNNNAVTSSFATSTSNNAVTSSFATSTSNNAVTSSFATSTNNNAVSSSAVTLSPTGTTTTPSVSTTPMQTTALAPVTAGTPSEVQEICLCRCGERLILANETKLFLEQFDIEIKENLTLDTKSLSAYIRTKTSAEDERPSAQNFGYLGISMLSITFGVLILSDLLSLFKIASKKKTS